MDLDKVEKQIQKAVGDYAQMAEFNGVPEIGILCLLYYFNGGTLSATDCEDEHQHAPHNDTHEHQHVNMMDLNSSSHDDDNNNDDDNNDNDNGYSSNIEQCNCYHWSSHSPNDNTDVDDYYYYIPKSLVKSSITKNIISSLAKLEDSIYVNTEKTNKNYDKNNQKQGTGDTIDSDHNSHNGHNDRNSNDNNGGYTKESESESASSILDQIMKSQQFQKKDKKKKKKKKKNHGGGQKQWQQQVQQRQEQQQHYQQQQAGDQPFNDMEQLNQGSITSEDKCKIVNQDLPTELLQQPPPPSNVVQRLQFWLCTSVAPSSSPTQRLLSPLLQILLLKLLYSNPIGGPFLYLATEAVRCLSLHSMPLHSSSSSSLTKFMSKHYKSHWAYYIFIYKIVLGERIKKHRILKGTVPYHVPTWDIVHGLDQRKWSSCNFECGTSTASTAISSKCSNAMKSCSSNGSQRLSASTPALSLSKENPANVSKSDDFESLIYSILEHSLTSTCTTNKKHIEDKKSFPLISYSQRGKHMSFPPIYALGDSHILSIGWQTIKIRSCDTSKRKSNSNSNNNSNIGEDKSDEYRTIIPYPVTGLKAWHMRSSTRFFTHQNLKSNLSRLPKSCRTIILSAGEIDCREGIGGQMLEGYYKSCDDAVYNTVREYVSAVQDIAHEYELQILVLPVAPHAFRSEKNGKSKGRAMRRERTKLWNDLLRTMLCSQKSNGNGDAGTNDDEFSSEASTMKRSKQYFCDGNNRRVFLLDYEQDLRFEDKSSPVGYVLNKFYNSDYTHMNSAFLPHLELALERSGCNIDLI